MNPNLEPDPNDLTLLSERDSLNGAAQPVDDSPPWPETLAVGQKFVLRDDETNPWAAWVRILEIKKGWVRYIPEDEKSVAIPDERRQDYWVPLSSEISRFTALYAPWPNHETP